MPEVGAVGNLLPVNCDQRHCGGLAAPVEGTLPVALQRFVGEHETSWGLFAAGAILASLPVMALFYALQRHLVGGLTAGSVKG